MLILHTDGTTDIKDAVHNTAFTMTGGVSGAWTEESNFQLPVSTGLLGSYAPVIAQATDNLLVDENASFEGGTVGDWSLVDFCTRAASTAQAYHGSYSLAITASAFFFDCGIDVSSVTSASNGYTVSARIKGTVGTKYAFYMLDSVGSTTGTAVTADGTWQTIVCYHVYAGTGRTVYLMNTTGSSGGDVVYLDAIQLQLGSPQTPFALDYRTATTMTFPTASLGLKAGMPLTIMCVVNTPWDGTSADDHVLFDTGSAGGINRLAVGAGAGTAGVYTWDSTGAMKSTTGVINASNWAANTPHIIIVTMDSANSQHLFLDGVELTTHAGTGVRESALGTDIYVGTDLINIEQLNGSILCAVWGEVLSDAEIADLSDMTTWERYEGYDAGGRRLMFVDDTFARNGGVLGEALLNINDGTDYCLDTIEFPPPPPDIQWIEPGHADGRTRSLYRHNNRELMIKLNIFGSSKADLSDNIREVYEQFTVDKPILQFRGDGWTDYFYFDLISPPVEINTDDWFESFIRDSVKINVMSNVEFHVEALPWLRGPDEELIIFENLAPNPDMEDWTVGEPDH